MRRTIFATLILLPAAAWAVAPKKALLREGRPAPDFTLRTLDQRPTRLKNLRGRPVLIDYFRRNCEPCLKTFPELLELHQKYAPRGLQIVLIALLEDDVEDPRRLLAEFLAKEKPPFLVLVDDREDYAKQYLGNPHQLPGTFLIDAKGVVAKLKYGGAGGVRAELEPAIEAMLPPVVEKK